MKKFSELKVGDKIYLKDEDIKELEVERLEIRKGVTDFLYLYLKNYEYLVIAKRNFNKKFLVYPSSKFNHIYFSTSMDKLLLECEE